MQSTTAFKDDFIADDFAPDDDFVADDFTPDEEPKQERKLLNKGARIAGQFGLGLAEAAALPYDIAVAPLSMPGGQETLGDVFTRDVLNDVYPTEEEGRAPRATPFSQPQRELKEPIHIGTRDLIEKATGLDLKPEGVLEKAANWTGFIKDPRKLFELSKTGLKAADVAKAISPSGKEVLRGVGAGTALELAERGNFGPIGTLASLVIGDISGNLASKGAKVIKDIISNPRQALAEVATKFTKKDKINLQKEIIDDFKKSGIQADIGTLTNSDLVKWVQSRLAQSGLTGKALDELKTTQLEQIRSEYKKLAESLGQAKYATNHEAGEVLKESLTKIKDADLAEARNLYKQATDELSQTAHVNSKRIADEIANIERKLKPGNYKSAEQTAVLDILQKVKRDIYDSQGNVIYGSVKDLMNNKIALNEAIDYELQGGSKQLLKGVVSEIDRAIISHGKEKPGFARKYIQANRKFSEHAKTFRNKNISQLLKTHDASQLMNRFNSVQGIQDIRKILQKTPEGKQIYNDLSRLKLDQVIGNHLAENTAQQAKLGTFSKLLDKEKNRDIIKELMPKESYKRLQTLQKNAGTLAETAQKFLNASKSGVTLEDAGIVAKVLTDLGNLFVGNPWPLIKTGSTVAGARYLTRLMGDAQFLKLVEEAILAANNNDIPLMKKLAKEIAEPVKAAIIQTSRNNLSEKE